MKSIFENRTFLTILFTLCLLIGGAGLLSGFHPLIHGSMFHVVGLIGGFVMFAIGQVGLHCLHSPYK